MMRQIKNYVKTLLRDEVPIVPQQAVEFKRNILDSMLKRSHDLFVDNFDRDRFGEEVDFDSRRHGYYLEYFLDNYSGFYKSFNLLSDEESKELFVELILYRILGYRHIKLKTNTPQYWETQEQAKTAYVSPSQTEFETFRGKLKHFELAYKGKPIKCDCHERNVASSFLLNHYRLNRNNISIAQEKGDVVFDLGACLGDSALVFAAEVGSEGKTYSFDFMPNHLKIIEYNISQNPWLNGNIIVCPFAVGDQTEIKEDSSVIEDGAVIMPGASLVYGNVDTTNVSTITIDDFVKRNNVESIDFIKMDIEGYELNALKGAVNTLRKYKPKLAISLYHREEDFITIPQLLNDLDIGYKFYLNHYTIHAEETILFSTLE